MWWLTKGCAVLGTCGLLALAGCGSSGYDGAGTDGLTMQFIGFSGENIDQQDLVGTTSADVDVCPSLCALSGDLFDIEFEVFTQTRANAVFMNMGASDILLDRYTVSIPGSGVPARTANIAATLPGGTCSNNGQPCGDNTPCGVLGICEHVETPVEVMLFDFVTKELVRGDGTCPSIDFNTGEIIEGTVVPQTFQTNVTFSGSDASGERFTIKAGLVAGFFDANNCEDGGGGDE